MISRQALIDELHEIRALVWDENWDEAHQRILMFVTQIDQLIGVIHSLEGSEYKQPVRVADPFDVGFPKARSVRSFVTEAGFALKHLDSRRAAKALEEAVRTLEEPTAEGE